MTGRGTIGAGDPHYGTDACRVRRLARACMIGLALALLSILPAGRAQAEPAITWRVENPFRFFVDPADTEVHRSTFEALSPRSRLTPVLAAERALSERHPEGWAATMYDKVCWDAGKNRYGCASDPNYLSPTSHTILIEARGLEGAPAQCTWLTAPLDGRGRGQAMTAPCEEPVRLDIPYPAGARVTLDADGKRVAATTIKVEDLLIVGMGDSFASGEGNPDIPVRFSRERAASYGSARKGGDLDGYPARVGSWKQLGDTAFVNENARWLDQACHRSLYSHQLRAAVQLAIEYPWRAVTFVGLACSGAEVTNGLFLVYKGNEWVPNPPELSQISAAADAQCGAHPAPTIDLPEAFHLNNALPELKQIQLKSCPRDRARRIDLLLLSIGGNDVGFARLLANTVLDDSSTLRRLGGWFGHVHTAREALPQLDQLDLRYKALRRAVHTLLHIPWHEADRVVLTAYPGLALLDGGRDVCPDGRAGMDVLPDFRLSQQKVQEGETIAANLNARMAEVAQAHGWSYVDAHRKAFLGRGICSGFVEAAFSSVDDLRLPRQKGGVWEPYNPADYRPYASRQRWFRTPNDSFLTGHFHASQSLAQKLIRLDTLSWFQLVLASTYSGAFHPTAEGQAAIADAAVAQARRVLARYRPRAAAVE